MPVSVSEIPENRRQNGSTHSFKIITGLGTVFSYYKTRSWPKIPWCIGCDAGYD